MKVGIIPNISKENVGEVVEKIILSLNKLEIDYCISDSFIDHYIPLKEKFSDPQFLPNMELFAQSDIIFSIGGDGTMLNTAYEARNFDKPLLGINIGKLGFLAEFDLNNIDSLFRELKDGEYVIEERMALEAVCCNGDNRKLFAVNDLVFDKGPWPKMINLTLKIDDQYVSTFSADGIIIATPTGSTGYSLSTGGPIVSPKAKAITISPISPHTLTMRPLVLSSEQKIRVTVDSPHTKVQLNCDGQRVHYYEPPVTLEVYKSDNPIKLIHTKSTNYFEILRKKLYWGLDIRNNPNGHS